MPTDRAPARQEGGFTLIEVLAAMLILAVGLLGLEALGIGASRMVVRAEKESRFSTLASRQLEDAMRAVRQNPATGVSCTTTIAVATTTIRPDTVCVTVEAVTGLAAARRVTVSIRPSRGGAVPVQPFTVSSTVYNPVTIP